ncbi:MAG: hypothetical protein ACTSPB_04130 [Candidatus Thorarchaeota archaeon]
MPAKPTRPTRSVAMAAKCHNCTGGYLDGKKDCENTQCELYPWMPYKKMKPDLEWLKYNPKQKGLVTWEDSQRDLTDEQRQAIADRLSKSRKLEADCEDLF